MSRPPRGRVGRKKKIKIPPTVKPLIISYTISCGCGFKTNKVRDAFNHIKMTGHTMRLVGTIHSWRDSPYTTPSSLAETGLQRIDYVTKYTCGCGFKEYRVSKAVSHWSCTRHRIRFEARLGLAEMAAYGIIGERRASRGKARLSPASCARGCRTRLFSGGGNGFYEASPNHSSSIRTYHIIATW